MYGSGPSLHVAGGGIMGGALVVTGFNGTGYVLLGLVLLGTGFLLLRASRRTRIQAIGRADTPAHSQQKENSHV